MKVKVIKHYEKNDIHFSGDYDSIEIFIDNELAIEYGDAYHDRGSDAQRGCVDCLKYLHKTGYFDYGDVSAGMTRPDLDFEFVQMADKEW